MSASSNAAVDGFGGGFDGFGGGFDGFGGGCVGFGDSFGDPHGTEGTDGSLTGLEPLECLRKKLEILEENMCYRSIRAVRVRSAAHR